MELLIYRFYEGLYYIYLKKERKNKNNFDLVP